MTLRDVRRSDAFERIRGFEEAAHFHVWHSQLGVENGADRQAQEALRAQRGFAIAGPSGSGKTSTLAAAALATEGFERAHLPIGLSVAGDPGTVGDPRQIAVRLVRNIGINSEAAQGLADAAASEGTATGEQRSSRLQMGGRGTTLSTELKQRSESVSFDRTVEEVLVVAREATDTLHKAKVNPVLILEDADGLLRVPGMTPEDRHTLANAFFADGLLPVLSEVDIPVLIAIQQEYTALPGFKKVEELLDQPAVLAPAPPELGDGAIRRLIDETLKRSEANTDVARVFTEDAVELLSHNRFSLRAIRTLVDICAASVVKACEDGHEQVEESDLRYALSQENEVS